MQAVFLSPIEFDTMPARQTEGRTDQSTPTDLLFHVHNSKVFVCHVPCSHDSNRLLLRYRLTFIAPPRRRRSLTKTESLFTAGGRTRELFAGCSNSSFLSLSPFLFLLYQLPIWTAEVRGPSFDSEEPIEPEDSSSRSFSQ